MGSSSRFVRQLQELGVTLVSERSKVIVLLDMRYTGRE
jgi:hypothetical protein